MGSIAHPSHGMCARRRSVLASGVSGVQRLSLINSSVSGHFCVGRDFLSLLSFCEWSPRRASIIDEEEESSETMSATGVSASTSSNVFYRSGATPTSCRKRPSMAPTMPTVRRLGTPHFYIPGESTTGVFPNQRNSPDGDECPRKRSASRVWTLFPNRIWNLVQTTLKKGNECKLMSGC